MKERFERGQAAFAFLMEHSLEPTPRHYELALNYIDAPDGRLAREIRAIVEGGLRLTAEDAALLADRYTSFHGSPAIEAAQAQVLDQAARLETITTEAHQLTGGIGRDLAQLPPAEGRLADLAAMLVDRLGKAERDLATMAEEVAELRAQVAASAPAARDKRRDELTDLPSRVAADDLLPSLADEAHGFSVALCKLDQLPAINDSHGRSVGDNVVRAMAATLSQACEGHEVVRWTGDEFLAIFRGTPPTRAMSIIDTAREAMAARTLRLRGTGAPIGTVTFSAGLVGGRGIDPTEAVQRAKARALDAISAGGNRVLT